MKGMVGPLHGEAMTGSRKMAPTTSNASLCSSHISFTVHHQERVMMAPSNRRVLVHDQAMNNVHEATLWNLYGVGVDEHIDRKAALYISSVQERFKLEGLIN